MTAPSNANTSGLGDVGLSETYRFAYESIRNGAPGLSDAVSYTHLTLPTIYSV